MTTPHLGLPELVAAQNDPSEPINEALNLIDAVVQLSCITQQNTPPVSPTNGDRHIVGTVPTGAWVGHANDIAAYIDSAWTFFNPQAGWLAHLDSASALYMYGGATWAVVDTSGVTDDTIFDAKGDLVAGTGDNTAAVLTAGTNGYILYADSAQSTGLAWQLPPEEGYGAYYDCANLGETGDSEVFVVTDTTNAHQFRTLTEGTNIALTQDANTIEVESLIEPGPDGGAPVTGARVEKSAFQTISNNSEASVTWATELIDDDGFWTSAASGVVFTAPAAGWYTAQVNISWNMGGTGYRRCIMQTLDVSAGSAVTACGYVASPVNSVEEYFGQNVVSIVYLDIGDQVRVRALHTFGSSFEIHATSFDVFVSTNFAIIRHP
jgi:hypothetical protein